MSYSITRTRYLIEELLNVRLQGVRCLVHQLLCQTISILPLILDWIHHVLEDCVQQFIGDKIGLGDERAEDVHHEVLHLARVLVIDNLEHQAEQPNRDLSAVLEVEDHVEGLDVGQILKQVEVPLERGVLWILQARQLLDEEHEDGLDLAWLLIGGLSSKDAKDVRNAASSQ